MKLLQRPTTEEDIRYLVSNLREHDEQECRTLYPGFSPAVLIRSSVGHSVEGWTIVDPEFPDIPLGVGGVCSAEAPGFSVWLMGTKEMDKLKYQRALLRHGRELIQKLLKKYYRLQNYCSSDKGQLWAMERLGFTIVDIGSEDMRKIECVL